MARGRLHHWHQIYMRLHIRHKDAMGLIGTEIKIQRTHKYKCTYEYKYYICMHQQTRILRQNSPTEKIQAYFYQYIP